MPTFRHGKGQYLQIDNASGTLVDISSYVNEVSFPREIESGETTAFGNTAKTYIVGLQDATISVSGMYDATIDAQIVAVIAALDVGTTISTASFVYGPEGSAVSRIKYLGETIVTGYEVSAGVGDVVTFSLDLQCTGAITRTTF